MSEITPSQLNASLDRSFGSLNTALELVGVGSELHETDQSQVPHLDFQAFEYSLNTRLANAGAPLAEVKGGRMALKSPHSLHLEGYEGLRGFAAAQVRNSQGETQRLVGPAILLQGAGQVAMLTVERPSNEISQLQHTLLEVEYAKNSATVLATHTAADSDITNLAPALMIASTKLGNNPHSEMHGMATTNRAFGANFSTDGRQDIATSQGTRRVRSAVLPVKNIAFFVSERDQVAYGETPMGIDISSGRLAVGLTIAASTSMLDSSQGRLIDRLATNTDRMLND